ncbi:3-hydroxyisobutyryl-CoA hydrolase [Thraustotheca clavata]|uniref:3-hydroxyisobutyryl-CoA hydrolase n=1 Tax=Thraustotheca clavata TaxID=74557 RepID=A0A1W0A270_9STRA|nr:3-hydroxyisobutyryl-CoA hydrolase [Thraustotheca clavata]
MLQARALRGLMRLSRPAPMMFSSKAQNLEVQRQKLREAPFDEVLYGNDVGIRNVTFNRPKVLNALNLPMIRSLTPKIQKFEKNPAINAIIFEGAGEKAFCAGGDIRFLYDNGKNPETRHLALDFFREEYRLNYMLATMSTPVISIVNGITMGGGVGLSMHGKFVVATEKTTFAMPETAIGFFPDVGGSYILPRIGRKIAQQDDYRPLTDDSISGQGLGTFLALTGERLKGAEVFGVALATHFVESKEIADLRNHLVEFDFEPELRQSVRDDIIDEAIGDLETEVEETNEEFLDTVESVFGAHNKDDTVEGILERLTALNTDWSRKVHDKLLKLSPLSLKVTLRQMREGATKNAAECFQMEFRMATRMMENPDFFEGVRSVIIDKDNAPNWLHASVKDVTNEEVDRFFAPLPEDEELVLYQTSAVSDEE